MLPRVFFLLCALGLALEARGGVGVCGFYRDAYKTEIKSKIQAGVPFELMSAIFADGSLVEKKAVRVSFNLWDEIVSLKSGDQPLARFPFSDGENQLCKHLEVGDSLSNGRHYTYRLLLNPLWGERITRLQVASEGSVESGKIMGINWRKLATEMPSDKVLLEKDLQR